MKVDGIPMPLEGIGYIAASHVSLNDVYCIHSLAINLVSTSQLCESGFIVIFFPLLLVLWTHDLKR